MIRFSHIPNKDNKYDIYKVDIETICQEMSLPEVIEVFKAFLLAVGYASETVEECLGEK